MFHQIYPIARSRIFGEVLCIASLINLNSARSQSDPASTAKYNLTVYEGVGVGTLRLGDPVEKVEQIFGEAERGSEGDRGFVRLGIRIQLSHGKVYHIDFDEKFEGTLSKSGLGIGDTLSDLQRAYGPVVERREVPDIHGWSLDRALIVRKGGPQSEGWEASKVEYYDLGMRFYLDDKDRILHFGLSEKDGLHRDYGNRGSKDARVGVPSGTPDERITRWKAAKNRDWSVREGVGFGPFQFGDPSQLIEDVLGPPDSGSENSWQYRELGLSFSLNEGRIAAIFFFRGREDLFYTGSFPGKFETSGIGIGDSLKDVEEFYGTVLDRREVDNMATSAPSRTLLICHKCTAYSAGEASRLHYRDLGLYFDFDDQKRIFGFGLNQPRLAGKESAQGKE